MTIKILKQGRLPEEVTYKFGCNNCKTEFTAQKKDGVVRSDQFQRNWLEVACPLCHHRCTPWSEYKEPKYDRAPVYPPGVRGWQDKVVERPRPPIDWWSRINRFS